MRAIGVSHTACKDEFRRNLRSHSWSVFSFFIIYEFRQISDLTAGVYSYFYSIPSTVQTNDFTQSRTER